MPRHGRVIELTRSAMATSSLAINITRSNNAVVIEIHMLKHVCGSAMATSSLERSSTLSDEMQELKRRVLSYQQVCA